MKTKDTTKQFTENIDGATDVLMITANEDETMTALLQGNSERISRAILGVINSEKYKDMGKSLLKIIVDAMYSLAKNKSEYRNYVLDMMERTLEEERVNDMNELN